MKIFLKILIILISFASLASSGLLFSVISSGSPLGFPVIIELCLNAKSKPVSCQLFNIQNANLSINTATPNHIYPYAGIKVVDNSSLVVVSTSTCQMNPVNGYCLFNGTPNTSNPSRITIGSSEYEYSVGGTVSGLSGTVVLQDNGGDNHQYQWGLYIYKSGCKWCTLQCNGSNPSVRSNLYR